MDNVIEYLAKRREEILDDLASREPRVATELRAINKAIASLENAAKPEPGPYAGMKIIDAVRTYLENLGRPDTSESIARALADGGAALGIRGRFNVIDSIRYHVTVAKRLVLVPADDKHPAERIGLPEWASLPQEGGRA